MSNTFKSIIIGAFWGILLAGCTTPARYDSVATTCELYATALNTAAALNSAGKLSVDTQARIDATTPIAAKVCSGSAPTTDQAQIQKLADVVVEVLRDIQ